MSGWARLRGRMRRPLYLNLNMASRDLALFLALLPCAAAFIAPGFAPFRSALSSIRSGRSMSLRHSLAPSRNSRIVERSQMPRMSGASGFDYDVVIVGCGVGGHGAALHARAQVRLHRTNHPQSGSGRGPLDPCNCFPLIHISEPSLVSPADFFAHACWPR
jgi:hypothetical protein